MEYEFETWYNDGVLPEGAPEGTIPPALDAYNMNRIETGIKEAHDKINGLYSYQVPWNIEKNVGSICYTFGIDSYEGFSVGFGTPSGTSRHRIYSFEMINSGTIMFSCDAKYRYGHGLVKISIGENIVYNNTLSNTSEYYKSLRLSYNSVEVDKGDIVSLDITWTGTNDPSDISLHVNIKANVETPYKYFNVSEILTTKEGVD